MIFRSPIKAFGDDKIVSSRTIPFDPVALGQVYLYEAQGAVIGGVIFTYILIGSVPTFIIALAVSLGCIFASLGLLGKKISPGNV